MTQWTIESPTSLDFEDVTGLRVRLIAGSVAVLATDGKPSLDVANITGDPLNVSYEDGLLTISHENLTWEGLLKWLRPHRHSATVTVTVPRQCQTQVGVVSATAVMSGISAKASVKSVSGGITLDGVSGDVTADIDLDPLGGMQVTTVSGEVTLRLPAEADARVALHSLSGDVRSEFAELRRSGAPASHSVSGSLGAGSGHVSVTTMSGRVMLLRRAERGTGPDNTNEMEGETS
jgi:hypothetical protein